MASVKSHLFVRSTMHQERFSLFGIALIPPHHPPPQPLTTLGDHGPLLHHLHRNIGERCNTRTDNLRPKAEGGDTSFSVEDMKMLVGSRSYLNRAALY